MDKSVIGELIVTEPAGIVRGLEYIEVALSVDQLPLQGEGIFINSKKNEELTKGQILTSKIESDDPPLRPHHSIKELRKTPIDVNAKWFCFYNDSLKYGFGSVRIQYDYTNSEGNRSPMLNPETRITYAGKGGRYWDRRFVFVKDGGLKVPEGSRYAERNVYIIFRVNPENPVEKIREVYTKLTNPILAVYNEL